MISCASGCLAFRLRAVPFQTFRVAASLRGATLRHRMCTSNHSWFTQIVDFFDVINYPVHGYVPLEVITELHMHLWDCAVDYRYCCGW